jgi:hypothetical protein
MPAGVTARRVVAVVTRGGRSRNHWFGGVHVHNAGRLTGSVLLQQRPAPGINRLAVGFYAAATERVIVCFLIENEIDDHQHDDRYTHEPTQKILSHD